jgi:hypothetical protein
VRWRWIVAISFAVTWFAADCPEMLASVSERVSVYWFGPDTLTPTIGVPLLPRFG